MRSLKRTLAMILILVIVFAGSLIQAVDVDNYKEEAVYGVLKEDGSLDYMYVVNGVHGHDVDYGSYSEVENLSSTDPLTVGDGYIEIPTSDEIFYYQGMLSGDQAPWDFDLVYTLDGKEVKAEELAGASGELGIDIKVSQGNAEKAYFFDHYALQIQIALSGSVASHVKAEGATIVDAAGQRQIAFTVLPGNEAGLKVAAYVKDFEMDPININAVKMVFDMDVDTDAFTDQISELSDAVAQLDDGAGELKDGLVQLTDGLSELAQGMKAYKTGINEFAYGGVALYDGLKEISGGLSLMSQQGEGLKQGVAAFEQGALSQVESQLTAMGMEIPSLTKDNYQAILGANEALAPMLIQLQQTFGLTEGMTAYVDGVQMMAPGLSQVSDGMKSYIWNAALLAGSMDDIYGGSLEIEEGLKAIRDGMVEYKEGTSAFKEGTSEMEGQMQEEIDSMLADFMGDDAPLVSFVSDKNDNIESVQFFFRTGGISLEEEVEELVVVEEDKSFIDRLLDLFR